MKNKWSRTQRIIYYLETDVCRMLELELYDYYGKKRETFRRLTLDQWANKEVIKEIKAFPEMDPFTVVDDFRRRMDVLCCLTKTEEAREVFVSLYDASTFILDFLINFDWGDIE